MIRCWALYTAWIHLGVLLWVPWMPWRALWNRCDVKQEELPLYLQLRPKEPILRHHRWSRKIKKQDLLQLSRLNVTFRTSFSITGAIMTKVTTKTKCNPYSQRIMQWQQAMYFPSPAYRFVLFDLEHCAQTIARGVKFTSTGNIYFVFYLCIILVAFAFVALRGDTGDRIRILASQVLICLFSPLGWHCLWILSTCCCERKIRPPKISGRGTKQVWLPPTLVAYMMPLDMARAPETPANTRHKCPGWVKGLLGPCGPNATKSARIT